MKKSAGFSLIELIITLAILGLIAALAIPSYSGYMTKTRRAEATTLLTQVAGEQQRFFSENNTYAADLTEIGYPATAVESEAGSYEVTVTAQTTNTFTLRATRVTGAAQANDAECGDFEINSIGTKAVTGTGSVEDCW